MREESRGVGVLGLNELADLGEPRPTRGFVRQALGSFRLGSDARAEIGFFAVVELELGGMSFLRGQPPV